MPYKTVILNLTAKANEKGLRFKNVAEEVGIPADRIRDLMRGKEALTEEELKAICDKLGCDPSSFVAEPVATPQTTEAFPEVETVVPEVKEEKAEDYLPFMEETQKTNTSESVVETPWVEQLKGISPEELPEKKTRKKRTTAETSQTETVSTGKTKSKKPASLFPSEDEEVLRRLLGLKKSEAISADNISYAFSEIMGGVEKNLTAFSAVNALLCKQLELMQKTAVSERLKNLMDIAENATEEGIALAEAILKKFQK